MKKRELWMFYIPNSLDEENEEQEQGYDSKEEKYTYTPTGKHYADATWYPVKIFKDIHQEGLVEVPEEEQYWYLNLTEARWSSIMGEHTDTIRLNKRQYDAVVEQLQYKPADELDDDEKEQV